MMVHADGPGNEKVPSPNFSFVCGTSYLWLLADVRLDVAVIRLDIGLAASTLTLTLTFAP